MRPVRIDIHAHIFNGRDIPLKGYLLSRGDKGGVEKILAPILSPTIAKCIRRKLKQKGNIFFKIWCKLALGVAYLKMGSHYREWAKTLSKKVIEITSEMFETFQKDEIDLYIPLMLDYEYWFKNTPDEPIKRQIDNIYRNIVLEYKGKIHPFVPFDPARELAYRHELNNPDGCPEFLGSLDLVKDAIENKGFIGVKLYNALGYKPFNNASVNDKRRKRIKVHKKMGYHIFDGEEYDQVLLELYDYCVENEVPITTHCGMYGIESYHNASFDFGKAIFWRDVLSDNRYKNLHLNLAHFGWNLKEGYHGENSWVKDICRMMNEFDYLFADVACHRVTMFKDRQRYISDYKEISRDFPIIKKRLLFGTDWHVLKRVKNYEDFMESYVKVLKHVNPFTDEEIDDFLGGNALKFLGLLPGGKNRERLEKFYKKKEIDPPEWFKLTSS